MEDHQRIDLGPPATIALVAPIWLQDALQILLDGTSGINLIASATDVDSLTTLELEGTPDVVLLDANRETEVAIAEVEQIMRSWPRTDCIVLADNTTQLQRLKDVGASLSLLKGASPDRLKEVLQVLAEHKMRSEFSTRPLASRL